MFRFEPFTGPKEETHPIDPLPAGEYYFHCEVHPTMEGTVVVAPAKEGGGGGGTVVCAGTPEAVAAHPGSHTGRYLGAMLGVR